MPTAARGSSRLSTEGRAAGLPRIAILATGGTIAGAAASDEDLTGYKSAALTVGDVLAAVPSLSSRADIRAEQVANIDSSQMTVSVWLALARRINELLASDVDGIVVTHGTDTMEETAYFLHLTVKSRKPVVLVGAMRPATAIGADGPLNLLDAVTAAASPELAGHGVFVVMNGLLHGARPVAKTNTTNADAFKSHEFGCCGRVVQGRARLCQIPVRKHTLATEFDAVSLDSLPKVEIVYSYAGAGPDAARGVLAGAPAGIVSGGVGNGLVFGAVEEVLRQAVVGGVAVVRSSRVGTGEVTREACDDETGFVAAGDLTPQKARILLMLALTKTGDPREIQRMFREY